MSEQKKTVSDDPGAGLDLDAMFAAFVGCHAFVSCKGVTEDYRAAFDAGYRAALASQRSEEKR